MLGKKCDTDGCDKLAIIIHKNDEYYCPMCALDIQRGRTEEHKRTYCTNDNSIPIQR